MRHLLAEALASSVPPVVWRAETGFCHEPGSTAADVIRYEQETLGNVLGISPPQLAELAAYPAEALLWVTFTHADALRYGSAEDVTELRLDIPACVIATDDEGGFLLFFPDDLTQPTGAAAMADQLEHDSIPRDPRDVIEEAFQAAYEAKSPDANFELLNASGAVASDRAEFYALHGYRLADPAYPSTAAPGAEIKAAIPDDPREQLASEIAAHQHTAFILPSSDEGFLNFVQAEVKAAQMSELASRAPEIDDEEEKRRAGRGGGGMGNPADANLGANIRPEVGSGPGGLETYTTQKSADYRAFDPETANVSDYIRERLAEAERSANAPTLTLVTERLDQIEGLDPATREANEASTKRQEAERAASSGESVPGEVASHGGDYIAERLAEAERETKAGREGHGDELTVIERGEGNTLGGGGGRGMV